MKKWYQYWAVWVAIVAAVAGDALASANRNAIHINAVGYTAGVLILAAAVFAVVFVVQYSRDKKAAREAAEAAHAAELRDAWAKSRRPRQRPKRQPPLRKRSKPPKPLRKRSRPSPPLHNRSAQRRPAPRHQRGRARRLSATRSLGRPTIWTRSWSWPRITRTTT